MQQRTLVSDRTAPAVESDEIVDAPAGGWVWVDLVATAHDAHDLIAIADRFGLDRIAMRDAVVDDDHPKVDDFGDHLLIVLHGLRDRESSSEAHIATSEINMFVSRDRMFTVHTGHSTAVDAVWQQLQARRDLAALGIDEVAAHLANALTRRLMSVVDAFDDRVEDLIDAAIRADAGLLEDLTAVRRDLVGVRRVVHPQREAIDVLRSTTSDVITDAGRRRFSDVFDVAARTATGLDEARSALAETLDAYRGAEARQATEVSKVLTIYAAIMLPLSLIAGFFGMNFVNLPWAGRDWGWIAATGLMLLVAIVSLGVFVSLGWIRRPSGRQTGRTLGRGLLEASLTPVQLVGAVFEMSAMPIRATSERIGKAIDDRPDPTPRRVPLGDPGRSSDGAPDDAPTYGSE